MHVTDNNTKFVKHIMILDKMVLGNCIVAGCGMTECTTSPPFDFDTDN